MPTLEVILESVQASGEHRGTATVTMDDGRVIGPKSVRADTAQGWTDLIAEIEDQMIEEQTWNDAADAVDQNLDVVGDYLLATEKHQCYLYLERGFDEEEVDLASDLDWKAKEYLDRENINKNKIVEHLAEVGLTEEKWEDDGWRERYEYLTDSGRTVTIEAHKNVRKDDPKVK